MMLSIILSFNDLLLLWDSLTLSHWLYEALLQGAGTHRPMRSASVVVDQNAAHDALGLAYNLGGHVVLI